MKKIKNSSAKPNFMKESMATNYAQFLNKNFGLIQPRKKKVAKKNKSTKKKEEIYSPKATSQFFELSSKLSPKALSHTRNFKSRDFLKETDRIEKKQRKQTKININFQIKNLNIYKGTSPLKKGHKKTITGLDTNTFNSEFKKQKHKINTKYENDHLKKTIKTTLHRKTKSQEIVPAKPFNYEKFLNKQTDQNSIITKFMVTTKPGILDNKPKVNQDAYIVHSNFIMSNMSLFGVCDGHGINGHFVSEFIKEILPQNLEDFLFRSKCFINNFDKKLLESAIISSFKKTSLDLHNSGIDITFSGSTTVITFIIQNIIFCANIGDSRAVIFNQNISSKWDYQQLSVDHNAEVESEAKRIIQSKGRLQPYRDQQGNQMGPYRVWLESQQLPGLAMTRSFGDYVASSVGVISEPQIIQYEITKKDKFMVIASDGLWQFISNEQVMQIVIPCFLRNDSHEAARLLQKKAVKIWQEQDQIVDDITIIVIFFNSY